MVYKVYIVVVLLLLTITLMHSDAQFSRADYFIKSVSNNLCRRCPLLERSLIPTNLTVIGNADNRRYGGGHPVGFVAVIDALRLLYIPLPKCGSTSWRTFSRAMGAVVTVFNKLTDEQKNYTKFTIVRDPVPRFFSGLGTLVSRTCPHCFPNMTGVPLVKAILKRAIDNPIFDEHITPESYFISPFIYSTSWLRSDDIFLIPYEKSHDAMVALKSIYLETIHPLGDTKQTSSPSSSASAVLASAPPTSAPSYYFAYDIDAPMNVREGAISGHHTNLNINPETGKDLQWDDLDLATTERLCQVFIFDFQCFSCFNLHWHERCTVALLTGHA